MVIRARVQLTLPSRVDKANAWPYLIALPSALPSTLRTIRAVFKLSTGEVIPWAWVPLALTKQSFRCALAMRELGWVLVPSHLSKITSPMWIRLSFTVVNWIFEFILNSINFILNLANRRFLNLPDCWFWHSRRLVSECTTRYCFVGPSSPLWHPSSRMEFI